uniref:Endonuclease/exonuclease/phosphatase domain-containing protein n=1 Tax=Peronospora matthiolae TaxID=2874970 RepID=A0AAV1UH13_9STRA
MKAWRRTPVSSRPLAWCIQETHVTSVEEEAELRQEWRRLWGKHHDSSQAPMSFWTVGSSKTSGVTILLTPTAATRAVAWNEDKWHSRAIGITVQDLCILNVYAHNLRGEREAFFTSLHEWNLPPGRTALLGDFN